MLQGLVLTLDGRMNDAYDRFIQLAQSSEGHGLIDQQVMASILAQCCLCQSGDHEDMATKVDQLAALQVATSNQASCWIQLFKAWFHHHQNRSDAAERSMQHAIKLGLASDWNPALTFVLATLIQQKSCHQSMLKIEYARFEQFLPLACFLSSDDVA